MIICHCILYRFEANNNNKKYCYKDEATCKKSIFFRKDNECLVTCKPYFEVVDEENINKDL